MRKAYYPFCVQIELVQGCNRRCPFCGTNGIERAFHFMEAGTITHVAKLLQRFKFTGRILLAGHGEPTLHPHIEACIRALRRGLPECQISIFTNGVGILKNPRMMEKIFEAGANTIMFDEYKDNRIAGEVQKIPLAREIGVERLAPGVPMFAKAKRRILIAPPVDENATASHKLCNHCGAGTPKLRKPLERPCSIIFRDFFIRWDGGIAICCNDFRGEYPVTNIAECRTFEDAYYHPRLEAARRILMQGDRSFYPCSVCNELPSRQGLLPDKMGKYRMPLPTAEDFRLARERREPLAVIRKREWEGMKK